MGLANWLTLLRILLIPVFVSLLVYRRPGPALIVFGLYRFAFDRYLGGTLSAIVVGAVLLHPAVSRAYGAAGLSRAADSAEAVAPPQ